LVGLLERFNFQFNVRHTKIIENINVKKLTEAGAGTGAMLWKKDPGDGATFMKTKISAARAGAKFMKRRAPKPELCPYYGDSAALLRTVMFNTAQSVRL